MIEPGLDEIPGDSFVNSSLWTPMPNVTLIKHDNHDKHDKHEKHNKHNKHD